MTWESKTPMTWESKTWLGSQKRPPPFLLLLCFEPFVVQVFGVDCEQLLSNGSPCVRAALMVNCSFLMLNCFNDLFDNSLPTFVPTGTSSSTLNLYLTSGTVDILSFWNLALTGCGFTTETAMMDCLVGNPESLAVTCSK